MSQLIERWVGGWVGGWVGRRTWAGLNRGFEGEILWEEGVWIVDA